MFYSLTGKVVHTEPGMAVVDVGGVAFKCATSMGTLRVLQLNKAANLYTHLNVREDALDLFGFASQQELNCFKLLTAISGVGPKVGLAILSEMAPEEVALAAAGGDVKRFCRANGVGPKLAQRIVLEMKDKAVDFSAGGLGADFIQPGGALPRATRPRRWRPLRRWAIRLRTRLRLWGGWTALCRWRS